MNFTANNHHDNNRIIKSIFQGFLFVALSLGLHSCANGVKISESKPVSHEIWDSLLKKHVVEGGLVDYKGFIADSLEFNRYLDILSKNHPNDKNWSDAEQQAYWINAYNAFTVQLIMRNHPVESIKDLGGSIYKVNTSWDIQFIHIEDQTYDLNNIEHGILRKKWSEPRVHFAINCASISCPKLRAEAFTAENLNEQLDQAANEFINNDSKNSIGTEHAEISRIFKWFSSDFTEHGTLIDFINKFSSTQINEDTSIDYREYNWALNE